MWVWRASILSSLGKVCSSLSDSCLEISISSSRQILLTQGDLFSILDMNLWMFKPTLLELYSEIESDLSCGTELSDHQKHSGCQIEETSSSLFHDPVNSNSFTFRLTMMMLKSMLGNFETICSRVGWFWNCGLGQSGIVGKWGTDPCTKEKKLDQIQQYCNFIWFFKDLVFL